MGRPTEGVVEEAAGLGGGLDSPAELAPGRSTRYRVVLRRRLQNFPQEAGSRRPACLARSLAAPVPKIREKGRRPLRGGKMVVIKCPRTEREAASRALDMPRGALRRRGAPSGEGLGGRRARGAGDPTGCARRRNAARAPSVSQSVSQS